MPHLPRGPLGPIVGPMPDSETDSTNQFSDGATTLGTRSRLIGAVLAPIGLVSVLAGAGIALVAGPEPQMMMLGFEVVAGLAFVLGWFVARGRIGAEGPALALASVAGTVFICSAFGALAGGGRQLAVGSVSIAPLLAFRVLASGIFGVLGAGTVLSRKPGSWTRFVIGLAIAAPILGAAGLAVLGKADPVLDQLSAQNSAVKLFVYLGLAILFTVMVSASTQMLVSAFERASKAPEAPQNA